MEQTTTKPNDRNAVIYWITGWRLLIIFTTFSLLSHTHNDGSGDVIHTAVLCVGMMTVVFGVTAYRFWPRLSFLFFLGTIAAHLGHIDFVAHPALANTNDLMAEFLMVSRLAIFELILAAFVSFVGKSLTRAKHGPDGYIDDLDISKILTRRFLIALMSLPVGTIVFLASASFFVGDFRWNDPVLLGELRRDYRVYAVWDWISDIHDRWCVVGTTAAACSTVCFALYLCRFIFEPCSCSDGSWQLCSTD